MGLHQFLRKHIINTEEEDTKMRSKSRARLGSVILIAIFLLILAIQFRQSTGSQSEGGDSSDDGVGNSKKRQLIGLQGGPDDLVWVVQLSDLHFSVHHPERARDFREIVGPALSFINPSLVLLTGDLTDGKSKDHLTSKQDEKEWIKYQNVMQDVVKRSGLNKSVFYDVRGNHDDFGVPVLGGSYDFFSKYSISGQLQRTGKVNSITIKTSKRKLLFVGFDSTFTGLRGPTNLFGHPTDKLLTEINTELSQWDAEPVTKFSFGHFPLSFSAASESGKTLQHIFLNHSLAAYMCGHLHLKFGTNLKRHHDLTRLIQFNGHQTTENSANCSKAATRNNEFWELEMGDWRNSRAMRVLAIDRGQTSFVDLDYKVGSRKTIILPTFPLDSRFTSSSTQNYKCGNVDPTLHGAVRTLVFSSSPIISVVAKIYDSSSGNLINVFDTEMVKLVGHRGNLYVAPWNIEAFEDPSPDRYFLQIEATDVMGRLSVTELRPFSVNGVPAKLKWNWKEFFVMGCQWDSLYYPILFCFYFLFVSTLILPKMLLSVQRRWVVYKEFKANKGFINGLAWIFTELYDVRVAWLGMTAYLFYLVLCPWFYGQVFTEGGEWGYMTYKGWVLRSKNVGKVEFVGSPDVMVVVIPHLFFVVLPAIVAVMGLGAESGIHRHYLLSRSSKKNDDHDSQDKGSVTVQRRWLRKILVVASLAICFKHFMSCVALVKAYEMNPIIHFPVCSFAVPMLLAYTIWKTG